MSFIYLFSYLVSPYHLTHLSFSSIPPLSSPTNPSLCIPRKPPNPNLKTKPNQTKQRKKPKNKKNRGGKTREKKNSPPPRSPHEEPPPYSPTQKQTVLSPHQHMSALRRAAGDERPCRGTESGCGSTRGVRRRVWVCRRRGAMGRFGEGLRGWTFFLIFGEGKGKGEGGDLKGGGADHINQV